MRSDEEFLLAKETSSEPFEALGSKYRNHELPHHGAHNKRRRYSFAYYLALHIILFIVCTDLIRHYTIPQPLFPHRYDSPASSAINLKISNEHATDHHKYSRYSGPPSNTNEQAWQSLIEPTLFGATREEMMIAHAPLENATELADGSGYLASLGVYHEMHCLRRLRLHLYAEKYYPNLPPSDRQTLQAHLDHCIETIRISLMCSADTSLYTFRWEEGDTRKPATASNAQRWCVDWERLDGWSRRRGVGVSPLLKPAR